MMGGWGGGRGAPDTLIWCHRKFRGPFTKWFGDRNKNGILADLKENVKFSPLSCVVMRSH